MCHLEAAEIYDPGGITATLLNLTVQESEAVGILWGKLPKG